MQIIINYQPSNDSYFYLLYDGPDGAWEYTGECKTLGEVFEKIMSHRFSTSQELVN